jgi:large subunit ribosomal protein L13
MYTKFQNLESVSRSWRLVDADGKVLGRMASQIASVLRGKHKPIYSPHMDTGDFVIVVNASKVQVTGAKAGNKLYWRHTGFPGGERSISFERQIVEKPERVIENAVRGMLPKGPLGRKMFKKLKVYRDDVHPHVAQCPTEMKI